MPINEIADTEVYKAQSKLMFINLIISSQKAIVDSDAPKYSIFVELREDRPLVVDTYKAALKELEAWKHVPEIKIGYDLIQQKFFEYSQGYVKLKRDFGKN